MKDFIYEGPVRIIYGAGQYKELKENPHTRRTNLREVYGHNAELQKKFLYNLDKPPCSVINLGLYDVRSYFMSLFK